MSNLKIYEAVRNVPAEAKKEIGAGRLKGMTDINPMWRIKILTEQFGACGFGWYYEIVKEEFVNGSDGQIAIFTNINMYIKVDGEWSKAIPGSGGSTFVAKEKMGMYTDDEAKKKALTDAIGNAAKNIGVGADVYWEKDSTKYTARQNADDNKPAAKQAPDDFTSKAIKEFDSCKTLADVTVVWKKYPTLSKNQAFIDACKAAQVKVNNVSK